MKEENSISHIGILGMKWGKRKSGSQTIIRPSSADHNKQVELRSKKVHEMSNDEIQAFNKRASLEKQYKELTKKQIGIGRKIVNSIFKSASKGISDTTLKYVNSRSTKMVEDLITKLSKKTVEDTVTDAVKDATTKAAAKATTKAASNVTKRLLLPKP